MQSCSCALTAIWFNMAQGLDDGLRAKRKAAIMELEAVASLLVP